MSLTRKYIGNVVDAVQLTAENVYEVAEWAKGTVEVVDIAEGEKQLRVNVTPHKKYAWSFCKEGDWFVKDESGILRIFPDGIFHKIFSELELPITSVVKK